MMSPIDAGLSSLTRHLELDPRIPTSTLHAVEQSDSCLSCQRQNAVRCTRTRPCFAQPRSAQKQTLWQTAAGTHAEERRRADVSLHPDLLPRRAPDTDPLHVCTSMQGSKPRSARRPRASQAACCIVMTLQEAASCNQGFLC